MGRGDRPSFTVAELIAELQKFDPTLPTRALWDTMPSFDITRVFSLGDYIVLDCNDDWITIASDIREGRYPGIKLTAEENAELDAAG